MSFKNIIRLNILLLSVLTLLPTASHAEYVNIKLVGAGSYQNGCVLLEFPAGDFNSGGYLVIDPTQPGIKQMLAVALTALASGKSITVDREEGTPGKGAIASGCWGLTSYAQDIRLNSN